MTKYNTFLAAIALCAGVTAQAQSPQVSLGVDLALPVGDFGDFYSLGVGPAAGFELPVGDNLGVTAQISYQFLMTKSDYSDLVKSSSMLPAQVGLKYYFQDQQEGFYGHGMLGIHSNSVTTEDQTFTVLGQTTTIEGSTESSTNFSWGIGAGYMMEKLDIGLRYNSISPDSDIEGAKSSSYIGLRVAYLINVGG
jgi:outer membrane protein W